MYSEQVNRDRETRMAAAEGKQTVANQQPLTDTQVATIERTFQEMKDHLSMHGLTLFIR